MVPIPHVLAIVFGVECDSISNCNKNRADNFSALDDDTECATGPPGETMFAVFVGTVDKESFQGIPILALPCLLRSEGPRQDLCSPSA
eukprot:2514577-Pyramimonas_sp.AAC.1